MIKHLINHGNSAALVFDRPIMQLLGIEMDTPLRIFTDGNCLVIAPVRNSARERAFRAAMAEVNKRHAKTFARLAQYEGRNVAPRTATRPGTGRKTNPFRRG